MKFFIPLTDDDVQAERVFGAIAEFNGATVPSKRIYSLTWTHNGETYSGAVGIPAPGYYGTGNEPILAILDCGNLYKICTESRGGARGDAILVGKQTVVQRENFE